MTRGPLRTGSDELDAALGIGGYPRGCLVELYGPAATGKTRLVLHAIAEVQRDGGTAAIIHAEHRFAAGDAASVGVDPAQVLVTQPDCAEIALDIIETLTASGAVDLIVVDSIGALSRHGVAALRANTMGRALRQWTSIASRTGTTVLVVNRLQKPQPIERDAPLQASYGTEGGLAGSNALKFYASVRLDVRRVDEGTLVKVSKNRSAPPFREAMITWAASS